MKLKKPAISLIGLACLAHTSSATVVFLDDFTTTGQSDDVNFQYTGGRQSGTLGNLQYRQGNGNFGGTITGTIPNEASNSYKTQVSNASGPGTLWVVGGGPGFSFSSVSPEANFNTNPGLGGFMSVSFTLNPVTGSNGTSADWGAITIGAGDNSNFGASGTGARGQSINTAASHFGILFRDNGEFQAFDGATQVSVGTTFYDTTPTTPLAHTVELRISDVVDGNPWDGVNDALIDVYADGSASPVFSFTKTGGYTSNFITLQGFGASAGLSISQFDDFTVSVIPEPASTVMGLGGLLVFLSRRRRA